jgi:hypothetical protein
MRQFLKFILEWNSTCFGQFLCPSSGVIHCTLSNGVCHTGLLTAFEEYHGIPTWSCCSILLGSCLKTCMTYTIAECTVNNSWWTEELSETCRYPFQNKFEKLVHLVGFIIKKFVTMHGHVNVKFISRLFSYYYYYYQHQYHSHCDYSLLLLSMFYTFVIPSE